MSFPAPSVASNQIQETVLGSKQTALGLPSSGMAVTPMRLPSLKYSVPPAVCSPSLTLS